MKRKLFLQFFLYFLLIVFNSQVYGSFLNVKIKRIGEIISPQRGAKLFITREDLTYNGYLTIEGVAESKGRQIVKVEVSIDGGRHWKPAKGTAYWTFSFKPYPYRKYKIYVRAIDDKGQVSNYFSSGEINLIYFPGSMSDLVQGILNGLAKAYMSKNLNKYMAFISRNYQIEPKGWQKLKRQINYDFTHLSNIVLKFTLNKALRTDDLVIAEAFWRLYYAGLPEYKTGIVEIHFDASKGYKIIVQKGDLYFGQPPLGTNAEIILVGNATSTYPYAYDYNYNCNITVKDKDKSGSGRVYVRLKIYADTTLLFSSSSFLLRENPYNSGTFKGTKSVSTTSSPSSFKCEVEYTDELTASGTENVKRTCSLTTSTPIYPSNSNSNSQTCRY